MIKFFKLQFKSNVYPDSTNIRKNFSIGNFSKVCMYKFFMQNLLITKIFCNKLFYNTNIVLKIFQKLKFFIENFLKAQTCDRQISR